MFKLWRIEWLKLRRSSILAMAVVLPLLAVFQGRMFAAGFKDKAPELWGKLYIGSMSQFSSLILPVTITVVMAMLARMEHSHNGWKHLLALPVRREQVYLAKLSAGIALVVFSVAVFCVGMAAAGASLGAKGPVPYELLIARPFLAVVAALPIIALQFVLSLRFAHIGVPLAFGIAPALPSMLAANSDKYWIFYPWDYPIMVSMTEMFGVGDKGVLLYTLCAASFVIIVMMGFVQFRSKDVK